MRAWRSAHPTTTMRSKSSTCSPTSRSHPGAPAARGPERDPDADDRGRLPRPRRTRVITLGVLALGLLVLAVAGVTVAITRDNGRPDASVGSGLERRHGKWRPDRDGSDLRASDAARDPADRVGCARWALRARARRPARARRRHDRERRRYRPRRPTRRAAITSRGAGRVLVQRGLDATVADPHGGSTNASDGLAFPAVDGDGWWIANPRVVSRIIGSGPTARLPSPEMPRDRGGPRWLLVAGDGPARAVRVDSRATAAPAQPTGGGDE